MQDQDINAVLDNAEPKDFIASDRNNAGKTRATFFYHVPKTGGMFLFNILKFGILSKTKPEKRQQIITTRLDGYFEKGSATVLKPNRYPALIATHDGYGHHKRFQNPFFTLTALRDPVERVKSAFSYNVMRGKEDDSKSSFEAFIENNAENLITRYFSGPEWDEKEGCEAARKALESIGKILFQEDLNQGISDVITALGLPNILEGERINASNDYKPLFIDDFDAEIAERVNLDFTLYNSFKSREDQKAMNRASTTPQPITLLITEQGDRSGSKGRCIPVPTQHLPAWVRGADAD